MTQNNNNGQNDKALELLKSLETYKYQEREVKLGELTVRLAPLAAAETIEIFEGCTKYTDADAMVHWLKVEALSRSIVGVNEFRFDPKKMLEKKREIVLSFGDELIEYLFAEYCALDKGLKESIDKRESLDNI